MVDDLYAKGFPSQILIFLTRRKLLENVSFAKKFLHSRKLCVCGRALNYEFSTMC